MNVLWILLKFVTYIVWLEVPAMLRTKYYRYVVELSREIEIAKGYLQSPLGLVNGIAVTAS